MDWLVPVAAALGGLLACMLAHRFADWRTRCGLLLCPEELLEKDLSGQRFVVTGGSSGLGFHTVVQLVKQGGHVIVGCRRVADGRVDKLRAAVSQFRGSMEVKALDLSSLASVRQFATEVGDESLAGLCNNAGIMNCPFRRTNDGHELQFATNYLGHFLLTNLLMPQLAKAQGRKGRVANVSSCLSYRPMGKRFVLEAADLDFRNKKYNGWVGYGHSKLAQVLHAQELAKRHGDSIIATSLHPGSVFSNITRHMMSLSWRRATAYLEKVFTGQISSWHGIQTTLFCLLAEEGKHYESGRLVNGAYYSQNRSPYGYARGGGAVRGGWPIPNENPQALDTKLQAELFDKSAQMTSDGGGSGGGDSGDGAGSAPGEAGGAAKAPKIVPSA